MSKLCSASPASAHVLTLSAELTTLMGVSLQVYRPHSLGHLFGFCAWSSAICARAAAMSSSLVFA